MADVARTADLTSTPAAPSRARSARRPTPMTLWWSFVILGELAFILIVLGNSLHHENFALDYRWHMEAAQRLLDTGTPYHAWQLERHYSFQEAPILYPPIAFALFIPFLWLPPFLWWAIPISILLYCVTRHRPPLWAWALTLALCCWLPSLGVFLFGNPGMWIVAAVAAGTVWAWPFAFVFLKPTFAPIALLGVRHRSWWVTLGVMAAVSLLFGRVWLDWFTILANSDVTLSYNFPTIPLMVAPLIPWLADPRHPIHAWIARQRVRRQVGVVTQ